MDFDPSLSVRPRSVARHHQESSRYGANPETPQKTSRRRKSTRSHGAAPPSAEVISSLISSLSAISAPAEQFYDGRVSNGTGPKPAPATLSRDFLSHNVRDETISENPQPETFLHPDEAAIPPIVRTAKPPSGLSPLTAPKKNRSKAESPLVLTNSSILDSNRTRSSIGSISVEPRHMPSFASLQTVSTANSKGNKSMKVKESREKMRELDRERKRGLNKSNAADDDDGNRSNHTRRSSRNSVSSVNSKSAAGLSGAPEIPIRMASWHISYPDNFPDPISSAPVPSGSSSKRSIPDRDSSLRHSLGSATKRKSKPSANKAKLAEARSTREESKTSENSTLPSKGKGREKTVDDEEDSVEKRIHELKMQKELRRISQQTIAEHEDSENSARRGKSLRASDSTAGNVMVNRSASAMAAPGKENVNLGEEIISVRRDQREPLMRSVTEPVPVDHTKPFDHIAPERVSTSANRALPSEADSIDEAIEDYLADPRLSQRVRDPRTGRVIVFSEVGDPAGSVVFCCVGMGTTRYLTTFYDELATTLKLRLITPDRPGIGDSEPYEDGTGTPLNWPDDIRTICASLGITRFSVLAHSAGAVYALATALRMPEHIRGRIHLLAPWIPPSQMVAVGIQKDQVPNTSLPYGQRLLRSIPTPFLKVANSGFFSMTSNSFASAMPRNSPRRKKRRSLNDLDTHAKSQPPKLRDKDRHNNTKRNSLPTTSSLDHPPSPTRLSTASSNPSPNVPLHKSRSLDPARRSEFETRLTHAIWAAATTDANPAVDLLVCLERRSEIGFRYADVSKEMVIHHGAKDTRVPVENVTWLAGRMRRAELRVLEDEGHGLMASAGVMANVLGEVGREWEDWNAITGQSKG